MNECTGTTGEKLELEDLEENRPSYVPSQSESELSHTESRVALLDRYL